MFSRGLLPTNLAFAKLAIDTSVLAVDTSVVTHATDGLQPSTGGSIQSSPVQPSRWRRS
ncbi:hypothetical protein Y023_3878 [Burkholderia pseudomallei A79D]|nr:hypothetical protein Y023_3878 [Burkholderia pseudomallei A79D]KGX99387.1 hypothetical protein X997_4044 [Burkholderia pseudomallei A79C]